MAALARQSEAARRSSPALAKPPLDRARHSSCRSRHHHRPSAAGDGDQAGPTCGAAL